MDSNPEKEHGVVWLRNQDVFADIVALNPTTGNRRRLSQPRDDRHNINGWFAVLSGEFVAMYADGGVLYLYVRNTVIPFSNDVHIEVSGPFNGRELVVSSPDRETIRLCYRLDPTQVFSYDPTPNIEAEDFDFGLFLANISINAERKKLASNPKGHSEGLQD